MSEHALVRFHFQVLFFYLQTEALIAKTCTIKPYKGTLITSKCHHRDQERTVVYVHVNCKQHQHRPRSRRFLCLRCKTGCFCIDDPCSRTPTPVSADSEGLFSWPFCCGDVNCPDVGQFLQNRKSKVCQEAGSNVVSCRTCNGQIKNSVMRKIIKIINISLKYTI